MWKKPQQVAIRSVGALVGALLTACFPNNATGRIAYQGVDPMGAYSGAFYPGDCSASFATPTSEGQEQITYFQVSARAGFARVDLDVPGSTYVDPGSTKDGWRLDRDKCQVYDVHQAPPDDHGRIHVVMHVDCRLPGHSRVWGTFDGHCDVSR